MSLPSRFADRYLGSGARGTTERHIELVAIGLGLVLLLQLLVGGIGLAILGEPDPIRPAIEGYGEARVPGVAGVESEGRDEIVDRPLFWVTRKPENRVAGAGTAESESARRGSLKKVKVLGVFGSGGTAGVIARVEDNKQRVLLGEQVQGWTLDAVHPDRVEFSRSGRKQTLSLDQRPATGRQSANARQEKAGKQPRAGDLRSLREQLSKPKNDKARGELGFGGHTSDRD